ncbi:MAG TPA: M14 family metallopeptidase [Solirubrobacter sp.]
MLLASALLLGAPGAAAFAQDDEELRLVKVTAQNAASIQQLESRFDVGYVGEPTEAAVYLTSSDEALLRAEGYQVGAVVEDSSTWEARKAEIAAADEAEALAQKLAEEGKAGKGAKNAVDVPGETVIMRAYTFTNYAGRFLYVEAHNKAQTTTTGPTLQMSYAGPDGVYRPAVGFSQSGITPDGNDSTTQGNKLNDAGQYMYHRVLVALRGADANLAAGDITVRVASSSNSTDTSKVTEWAAKALPPRIAAFQKDFITKYMNPTEAYERLDGLAAEFPGIAEIIHLPEKTNGYQRPAMAMMAGTTALGSNPNATNAPLAVQLFSKAMGHLGGNLISAEFKNPGANDAPLGVAVNGNDIVVNLATGPTGALTSTAAQVVAAINANPAAAALLTAYTYGGNAGAGIVPAHAKAQLSDFLNGPAAIKGPFDQRVLRIGKQRDGTKTGVFIYCNQHAREWVTTITCVETAERLLRNYATDPTTKEYVDNLDIFILPSVNPDGGHYSFFDAAAQRRNMKNHCPITATTGGIGNRGSWGVDLNRNNTIGSLFDGYSGASTSCTSDTFSGPSETSEPEIRNEHWVVDTFPKIKFAINIHTHGGYFMWAPGAYISAGRVTLPSPNIGIEKYFFDVADDILSHIRSSRGTAILPQRTGPIADVLYSAAGNSADDQYYRKGIIAYSFEAGAQKIAVNATTGAISRTDVGFQPCFAGLGTGGGTGTCNTVQINEGHDSAMEFADGNYGLLQGALEYSKDVTPPATTIEYSAAQTGSEPINFRFNWVKEPSVIYYTKDGSTPTVIDCDNPGTSSTRCYSNQGPRRPGEVLTISALGVHDVKWMSVDIKGNQEAVKTQRFLIAADQENGTATGTVPATLSLSLGTPAAFGAFTPGVAKDYTAGTTANVITTAGDATLSVADPSSSNTGKLVNGTFTLAQPIQASASSLGGTGSAFKPVGGSASPTSLLTYSGPKSNDAVTLNFKQTIGANEALRTGSYSKTLTFTLSTTTP